MKKLLATAAVFAMGISSMANAQATSDDVSELLKKVRNGRVSESAEHKKRESEFLAKRDQQQKLLSDAVAEQKRLERESERLENQRNKNDEEITRQTQIRTERMGQLQEIFGVLQQAAGDARATINTSYVSVDVQNRQQEIDTLVEKAASTDKLPSLDEIRAWPSQMMIEMIESANVVTFPQEVGKVDVLVKL